MRSPRELFSGRPMLYGYEVIEADDMLYAVSPVCREETKDWQYIVDMFSVDGVFRLDELVTKNEADSDFAHATVFPGKSTPIQFVNREGITDFPIHGTLAIVICHHDGKMEELRFDEQDEKTHGIRGEYHIGDVICCVAISELGAEFLERCSPPCEQGDFTNLSDNDPRAPLLLVQRRNELQRLARLDWLDEERATSEGMPDPYKIISCLRMLFEVLQYQFFSSEASLA